MKNKKLKNIVIWQLLTLCASSRQGRVASSQLCFSPRIRFACRVGKRRSIIHSNVGGGEKFRILPEATGASPPDQARLRAGTNLPLRGFFLLGTFGGAVESALTRAG